VWSYAYGTPGREEPFDLCLVGENHYLVVGHTYQAGEWANGYAIMVDDNGDTLWTRTYGWDGQSDWFECVRPCPEGGFILAGNTGGNNTQELQVWLVRMDEQGDTLWTRNYGVADEDEWAQSLQVMPDSGFIVAARSPDVLAVFLLRTNLLGDTSWTGYYGYDTNEFYPYSIQILSDNGLALACSIGLNLDNQDMYVVRFGPEGQSVKDQPRLFPDQFTFNAYPNPFNSEATISFDLSSTSLVKLDVFDVQGRHVGNLLSDRLQSGSHKVFFDANNLASGIYFARMNAGGQTMTKKMVLLK
jgi:hypothetical protein